MNTLNH